VILTYYGGEVIDLKENNMFHEHSTSEELYARMIGHEMLKFAKEYDIHRLLQQIDSEATAMLAEIKAILDDAALDDPICFHRIEAVIRVFHSRGIQTCRHWEPD